MTPEEEAAAYWGSAENPFYPVKQRLAMALKALEFFGRENPIADTVRDEPAAHDVYRHREDGRTCILGEDGTWFVPLDAGGEGYTCERQHGSTKALVKAWSAYLDTLMDLRLEDGTPVLALVLAHDHALSDRLKSAMRGTP